MEPTHLVVVCCHGIWIGDPTTPDAGARDEEWLIADFQAGETPTYLADLRERIGGPVTDAGQKLLAEAHPTHDAVLHEALQNAVRVPELQDLVTAIAPQGNS